MSKSMVVDRNSVLVPVVAFLAAMHDQLGMRVQRAKHRLEMAFFLGDCAERHFGRKAERYTVGHSARRGTRTVRTAQGLTASLMAFVSVGIVILLGILIYSEVQSSLPTPSNNDLSNASSNATGTFADSMELAPLVILVGVAALILAVVQRFRA